MQVIYDYQLTKETADKLEANGWKIHLAKDDESIKGYCDENGLYMREYVALTASKNFDQVKDALFEVERILEVDILGETDHDGCPIHSFFYENPNWNGKTFEYDKNSELLETDEYRQMLYVSGWDCAVLMWGAPKTPRECAIELQKMRDIFLNGQVHSN